MNPMISKERKKVREKNLYSPYLAQIFDLQYSDEVLQPKTDGAPLADRFDLVKWQIK